MIQRKEHLVGKRAELGIGAETAAEMKNLIVMMNLIENDPDKNPPLVTVTIMIQEVTEATPEDQGGVIHLPTDHHIGHIHLGPMSPQTVVDTVVEEAILIVTATTVIGHIALNVLMIQIMTIEDQDTKGKSTNILHQMMTIDEVEADPEVAAGEEHELGRGHGPSVEHEAEVELVVAVLAGAEANGVVRAQRSEAGSGAGAIAATTVVALGTVPHGDPFLETRDRTATIAPVIDGPVEGTPVGPFQEIVYIGQNLPATAEADCWGRKVTF